MGDAPLLTYKYDPDYHQGHCHDSCEIPGFIHTKRTLDGDLARSIKGGANVGMAD